MISATSSTARAGQRSVDGSRLSRIFEQEKPLTVVSISCGPNHAHMPLAPHELDVVLGSRFARGKCSSASITCVASFRRPGETALTF